MERGDIDAVKGPSIGAAPSSNLACAECLPNGIDIEKDNVK